jgi:hypothetical protein
MCGHPHQVLHLAVRLGICRDGVEAPSLRCAVRTETHGFLSAMLLPQGMSDCPGERR